MAIALLFTSEKIILLVNCDNYTINYRLKGFEVNINLLLVLRFYNYKTQFRILRHEGVNVMDYREIITIEPDKRGGKPCIRGMRITVYDVLEYLASGMTALEILDDFPYLTETDIRACLAYAADREKTQMIVYTNETLI